MPTRREIIARIETPLTALYGEREARQIARIVVMELGGLCLTDLVAEPDKELGIDELDRIIGELAAGRPLQYVLGHTEFYGLDFQVREGVLIPRPETEELVERMLKQVSPTARILDVGTGSGCIAVSLSCELPEADVRAWDVSDEALAVARGNNDSLGASVRFEQHDVLTYQPDGRECYDVIVSNPPYVTEAERADMERNVLDWEPALALFVPDNDPLRFYRRIAQLGIDLLVPGGRLYFEINRAFGPDTVEMLRQMGYAEAFIEQDISGNDRFVIAKK